MLITIGVKHYKEREFLQNTEIFQQLISGLRGFGSFFSDFCQQGSICLADRLNSTLLCLGKPGLAFCVFP